MVLIACGVDAVPGKSEISVANQLVVNVDSRGTINVLRDQTGERISESAARQYVEAAIRAQAGTKVVVHTDPATPMESLVRVLDWLNRIGAATSDASEIRDV